MTFGPVPAGPHDMATAYAEGAVGRLTARREGDQRVVVTVPVSLDLTVVIGTRRIPAEVDLLVRVGLVARAAPDAVEIDVEPVRTTTSTPTSAPAASAGCSCAASATSTPRSATTSAVYVSTVLATPEASRSAASPCEPRSRERCSRL